MDVISFFVPGDAKTAGSKRAFTPKGWTRPIIVDDCKGSKDWKGDVKRFAVESYSGDPLECALEMTLTFVRVRPSGHFTTKGAVRPAAPPHPVSRPDVLKLARCVEDALTGLIYKDDSQICSEPLRKIWGPRPGVHVTIRELVELTAEQAIVTTGELNLA